MARGPPRLDKYERLIARFYEALVLFLIEIKVRGPHVVNTDEEGTLTTSRRRFIRNLASLCDRSKGGDTTSSIAVQDRDNCFVFWVAYNSSQNTGVWNAQLTDFLRGILAQLKEIVTMNPAQREGERHILVRKWAEFAWKRLKKESTILSNAVMKCLNHIENKEFGHPDVSILELDALERWLQQFESKPTTAEDGYRICQLAYDARNQPQMRTIQRLSQELIDGPNDEETLKAYRTVRHLVGRLADHIRVTRQLVEDAPNVQNLLDIYEVAAVESHVSVPVPLTDSHTTLSGILNRFFNPRDEEAEKIRQLLTQLNEQVGYEARIIKEYEKMATKQPIVHSEVQTLEHFYRNGFIFAGNDRFVGTSKPSCFCCKLYFRHHPSRPVEPDSHEECYPNWGPIRLSEGSKDPRYPEQLKIFNRMNEDIRNAVIEKVKSTHSMHFRHPNSLNGFSRSADSNGPFDTVLQIENQNKTSSESGEDSAGGVSL